MKLSQESLMINLKDGFNAWVEQMVVENESDKDFVKDLGIVAKQLNDKQIVSFDQCVDLILKSDICNVIGDEDDVNLFLCHLILDQVFEGAN